MVRRWPVPGVGAGLSLVPACEARGASDATSLRRLVVVALFEARAPRGLLAEIGLTLGGSLAESDEQLWRRVREALFDGRLVVVRGEQAEGRGGQAQEQPQEAPAPAAPTDLETKTWITIRLVDEEDRPIGYARYRIELPDGTVRDGRLDAAGVAHHAGIDPGTCRVTFPEYDGEAWERRS